ncbi:putative WRKY transcription factor 41 [Morus notabilis]|uniref:Putative WRKY transcription factor 41 n=1 Tax=Morus notabilis TaxID=981085 RepID=W9RQ80_9ROSA|nr:probable WRKY transcription factor 53 [Morus notabilis]EXC02925.1 putative WRKY transcription factor 41 [Morus notabilis]
MEGSCSWEQKTLIGELIQGMELAKQLRQNLGVKSSAETREFLVQRILSSYEKALLILKWGGSMGQQQPQALGVATNLPVPESPMSVNESPRSDDQDLIRDGSKKRKVLPRWTDQVRVSSENGLEGPQDDGYSWRKYGQKDILGAKYPRSYYRCTFRNTQSCWATKQVQRSDEDPYLFEITYRGTHTCSQASNSVQPPTSPQNHDQKPNNHNSIIPQQQQFGHCSHKLPSNLRVVTELGESAFTFPSSQYGGLNGEDGFSPLVLESETFMGSFSRSFVSPATPESGYYAPFQMNNSAGLQYVHRSESDLTEIISANTSATNSPIPDMDFSLDSVDIDPNFPFDTPGFFS